MCPGTHYLVSMPIRLLALLTLAAAVLGGCGTEDASLDASNPQVVYEATMRAVHDGDWGQLQQLLTKDARFALEHDMNRLQKNLATPRSGSQLMRVVEHQLGEGHQAAVAEAVAGGMPEMLRFFVKLSPREREPGLRGMKLEPGSQTVTIPYLLANGEEKTVTLVQARGRWYVSNLQL